MELIGYCAFQAADGADSGTFLYPEIRAIHG
jgi:hypothetical protein